MAETPAPPWLLYAPFPLGPALPVGEVVSAASYGDRRLDTIATALDRAFYRRLAGDRLPPDGDPVRHYAAEGWRAGLDPAPWFDTAWYLDTYPDVRQAGMNPLFHYLAFGRREGRQPRRPGGRLRSVLERASIPAERRPGYDAPPDAPRLDTTALCHAFAHAAAAARALVVAVSHDCYLHVTGGMQVLIADEQTLFNADRALYLHLAPAIARLTLDPEAPAPALLQVSLDGNFLGLATDEALHNALVRLDADLPARRLFIVHSPFGHRAEGLIRLASALRPSHSFFWLHDFAAVCEGFNLLRNDIAFCAAPDQDSAGCRICVYGATRPAYRAALHRLFAAVPFDVLAPGRAALDLFLARAGLPCRSARVHENLTVVDIPRDAPDSNVEQPVRVAFVGYRLPQKGWPAFLDLFEAAGHLTGHVFHHVASPAALADEPGLVPVPAQVTPADRFATVRALQAAQIDLVLVLSPWPETFSYVTHEAFAAGADVIALADSGNVADAIRRHRRGVVLADASALVPFFRDGFAAALVRRRRAEGRAHARLDLSGSTATLDLRDAAAPSTTTDPALEAVLPAERLAPVRAGDTWRFDLPDGVRRLRLVSRRLPPTPGEPPRGIGVAALALDGTELSLDDPRLGAGWHPGVDGIRWTDGDATLACLAARRLELRLAPGSRYRALPLLEA